jgi:hypothetical protein
MGSKCKQSTQIYTQSLTTACHFLLSTFCTLHVDPTHHIIYPLDPNHKGG